MPETQTQPPVPAQTRMQKLKKHYDLHKRKVIILGLLVILLVVMFNLTPGDSSRDSYQAEPLDFGVVEVTPRSITANKDTTIEIKFNFPVTAHHAEEFLVLSQNVPGKWEQGGAANTIVFRPIAPFSAGSIVSVIVKAGLPSEAGKKLAADFAFDFTIKLDGEDMRFMRGYESYSLTSFSAQTGIDLTLSMGDQIKNPSVVLYKAPNENAMLQDLVYHNPAPEYTSNILYSNYNLYTPPVKDFAEIQKFNIAETNQIKYQGEPGIYYLVGMDGDKQVEDAWVLINKTGIFFRQDDRQVVLAAQDLATQKELSNIPVTFYHMDQKVQPVRTNIINGITSIGFDFPNRVDLVLAKNAGEVVAVPVYLPNSRAEINVYQNLDQKLTIFVSTDRPIYKPGDMVKYRAVVRIDNDGVYRIPVTGTEVTFDASGLGVIQTNKTDAAGIISGEIKIPADRAASPYGPDYIYLQATTKPDNYVGGTSFEVAQYTKPDFDINVEMDSTDLVKKDVVRARVKGETLTGEPLKNTKVDYVIYRRDFYETEKAVYNTSFNITEWGGMCGGGFGFWDEYYGEEIKSGEVTLDGNGQAVIEFQTADMNSIISQEITIVAKRKDATGNDISGAKTAVVHAGDFNIFVTTRPFTAKSDEQFTVAYMAETRDGQKLGNREFDYTIYRLNYGTGGSQAVKEQLKKGKTTTNANGVGYVKESLPANDSSAVFMEITGLDGRGNTVGGTRYLSILTEAQLAYSEQTQLKIVSEESNLIVGEHASLTVESPADLTVLVSFERGRVYDARWQNFKKGSNILTFEVKEGYAPSITPTFAFFHGGNYYIEGLSLNVPAMRNLVNVAVTTDKQTYKPGETAKITIKTTDFSNRPVVANVGAAVVDKAIFALRKQASASIHSSFYFFRPRQTNASSSMSGIVSYPSGGKGGGGGGDGTLPDKLVDTLYWNPDLKTDASGTVTIEVPVTTYLTTWRVQAYASTSDTKVGQGTQDFIVN